MANINLKDLKKVYYRNETVFGETYDGTDAYQEIKVSEVTLEKNTEKLETKYQTNDRILGMTTSTGRKTGKMTFKKNIDKTLLSNHSDLISMGLGNVEGTSVNETITVISDASGIVTLTIGVDWSVYVGEPVQITYANGSDSNFNIIESATPTTVTLKFALSNEQIANITVGDDLWLRKKVVLGKPNNTKSFQFILEFADGSIECLRGSGITSNFAITREGKGEISFEVQSAIAQNKLNKTTILVKPSGTITIEDVSKTIYFDFCLNYIGDPTNSYAPISKVSQTLELNVANTLSPQKMSGGCTNNIGGYTSLPTVTLDMGFLRTEQNMLYMGSDYENIIGQIVFVSQSNFGFYVPYANFTNENTAYDNDYDGLQYHVDANSHSDYESILILPQ